MQGFTLLQEDFVSEEPFQVRRYRHDGTGASVYHLKNEDPNKMFAIAFPTNAMGATGNMHIMEHCVLNGSRKFRTKEPMWDIMKSSLQTFLNAMTYPDCTVFPVASRNDADFRNLTELYLDSVFYPRVLEEPLIFAQEGWHREIFSEEEPIRYNGVVYNEMRGALSAPDQQVWLQALSAIFPDQPYAKNYGGDPYEIPTLSYEAFCDFHHRYYYPSNALVFLYGAIDEEEIFGLLHSYFDAFPKQEPAPRPARQKHFCAPKEAVYPIAVAEEETVENKSYLAMNWIVDEARTDCSRYFAHLLGPVLTDSESSPLRRRLLEELGAEDVFSLEFPVREIGFSIVAKHVDPARKEEFARIVEESLETMAKEGVDPAILEGALQRMEFDLREKNGEATKAITHLSTFLAEGIYGLDPTPVFHYEQQLKDVRRLLSQGGFETWLRKHLLQNPHRVLSVHTPDPGRNVRRDREVEKELAAYKASLSPEALQALIQKNEALRTRQNTPDTEEDKATIPSLSRAVLPHKLAKIPSRLTTHGSDTVLFQDLPTAGIHYLIVAFDLAHLPAEDLPYAALAADFLGRLDTEKHSYQAYEVAETRYTGGITMRPSMQRIEGSTKLSRKLLVDMAVMGEENTAMAFSLLREQLLETRFTDLARMRELLAISVTNLKQSILSGGHAFAMERALAMTEPAAYHRQFFSGVPYLRFLEHLQQNFTEEEASHLADVAKRLFVAPGRVINVTADGASGERFLTAALQALDGFPQKDEPLATIPFTAKQQAEAYYGSTDVQFNAVAAPFCSPDALDGSMLVLTNVLTNALLYNEIRAKGGAYGAFARFTGSGYALMASYRDPKLEETYRVYQNLGKMVRELALSPKELDDFVIGTVGHMDAPLTEEQKGRRALLQYLSGHDPAIDDKRLQEALAADLKSLHQLGEKLETAMENVSVVTVGSRERIEVVSSFAVVEKL